MPVPLVTGQSWEISNQLWSQILSPVINNPITQGQLMSGIALVSGTPKTLNHSLGRMMKGWFVVDNTTNSNVWRTQALNTQTLTLQASASTTISIWVF